MSLYKLNRDSGIAFVHKASRHAVSIATMHMTWHCTFQLACLKSTIRSASMGPRPCEGPEKECLDRSTAANSTVTR